MSRIISNGRVSELLCQNVMETLGVKKGVKSFFTFVKNGDYLLYLLNKNGYVVIKRFDAKETIIQVGEKRLKSSLS